VIRNQSTLAHHEQHTEVLACRRMWASVVRTAADDLFNAKKKFDPKKRYYMGPADAARAWFTSEEDGVGSFLWVCDILDLNAQAIRGVMLNGHFEHSRGKYAGLIHQFNLRSRGGKGDDDEPDPEDPDTKV
jgi:hypothetical protein